ncbi:hypothetical protein P170DRAFT_131368 [Aspergillus steynii IBT 23096]|uniref:Uncharacterized protein n=1 Tax=Aspergillus steynii IBT 23096 TaxID=1392250 RepID=A0A2I2GKU9_9EURO|nr:uncharacterized protein P170DRAFT_131368 [Aspergillus steynii IBT 23096]PLB53512.1 hypothetical protein P170DRAFT_131368 [Aspergillus steynii IBT 23096]
MTWVLPVQTFADFFWPAIFLFVSFYRHFWVSSDRENCPFGIIPLLSLFYVNLCSGKRTYDCILVRHLQTSGLGLTDGRSHALVLSGVIALGAEVELPWRHGLGMEPVSTIVLYIHEHMIFIFVQSIDGSTHRTVYISKKH